MERLEYFVTVLVLFHMTCGSLPVDAIRRAPWGTCLSRFDEVFHKLDELEMTQTETTANLRNMVEMVMTEITAKLDRNDDMVEMVMRERNRSLSRFDEVFHKLDELEMTQTELTNMVIMVMREWKPSLLRFDEVFHKLTELGMTQTEITAKLTKMDRNDGYNDRCPNGWTTYENSCYGFFDNSKLTWDQGVQQCASFCGGHLANFETYHEQEFLTESVKKLKNSVGTGKFYWVGATKHNQEGSWVWFSSGELVSAGGARWFPGQSSGQYEECGILWGNGDYTFHDHTCSLKGFFICEKQMGSGGCVEQYSVELDIFSGRPNPKWMINRLHPLFARTDMGVGTIPSSRFHIQSTIDKGTYIVTGTNPFFETEMFDSNPAPLPAKFRKIVTNSKDMREKNTNSNPATNTEDYCVRNEPNIADFSTNPVFDPERWNTNGHTLKCNNCYNYATQRMTDTIAQPGLGSGEKYTADTAENVMAAAVRDGFLNAGDVLSPIPDDEFFYMALVIWPGYDYHWYRRDSDGTWSHKRGYYNATNTDNAGQRITDPRTADRGYYTIFAGFVKNFWGPNID